MKPAAIKHLVETQSLPRLLAAEQALLRGASPGFPISGDSAGEQLTHVLAAGFILGYMQKNEASFAAASRVFFQRVRESIS
ncbi:hypothetical protein GCM10023185_22520 [Hymenobacter saemangeumensis]|uniref:Uncharacterized protein n=1 Tax=Hymenobacter saemangeumensis TaxID=1084522 RepID=A0ABP8IF76_9BACT